MQHEAGANKIFPASADLKDDAARTVVTSYAVKRPDGNWSLMLINHDLQAAHPVHIVIDDANHVGHSFVGSVALVQYSNTPAENKNVTIAAAPDGMYTLPAGSITVIRGNLRSSADCHCLNPRLRICSVEMWRCDWSRLSMQVTSLTHRSLRYSRRFVADINGQNGSGRARRKRPHIMAQTMFMVCELVVDHRDEVLANIG